MKTIFVVDANGTNLVAAIIEKYSGAAFDPALVEVFLSVAGEFFAYSTGENK